jgi:hypothetical protein
VIGDLRPVGLQEGLRALVRAEPIP